MRESCGEPKNFKDFKVNLQFSFQNYKSSPIKRFIGQEYKGTKTQALDIMKVKNLLA